MELLSVIMSVYNETEEQIQEAVNSVLHQSYNNFEFIIVYDNPNNLSLKEYVYNLSLIDSRIRIIFNEKNIGLAMSMNRAAEVCNGEILVRMDADDICLPERFTEELSFLKTNNYDLVFSNYCFINENGKLINSGVSELVYTQSNNISYDIFMNGLIHHPTVMVKKNIFEKAGRYRNYPCAQDRDLWLRMIYIGCRFGFLNKMLLKYRIRETGVTKKNPLKQYLTINYINKLFLERIKRRTDSYSVENYNKYLKAKKFDNPSQIEKFIKAKSKMETAKKTRNPYSRFLIRLTVFLTNKPIRDNYIIRSLSKNKVKNYIRK